MYTGYKKLSLNDNELNELYTTHNLSGYDFLENEYLCVTAENSEECDYFQYRNGELRQVRFSIIDNPYTGKYKPRNDEQIFAFDMLKDEQTTIKLITGRFGTGKAQPDDTLIPTPNGMVLLKDLQVGDYVFDRRGLPTKILGIYPQGLKDNYKVTFSDGRSTYCNNEHLWTYITSKGNYKTITLQEMIDTGLKTVSGSYRYSIPLNAPVQYPEKVYTVAPYVIGLLLGDGCCLESSLSFSSEDEELVSTLAQSIGAASYERVHTNNHTWIFRNSDGSRIHTKTLLADCPELINYSYNKFIPMQYLYGSVDQRLSLLQGLLDTDGSIDAIKGRVRFATTSKQLAEQVKELCFSLGYSASISIDQRSTKYTTGECYSVQIRCPYTEKIKLFRLTRKLNIAKGLKKERLYAKTLTIHNIQKMESAVPMRCIYVDNDEHLYLTNDYIVTHNTLMLVVAALEALEKGRFERIIWVRNNVQVKDTDPLGALPGDAYEKLLPYLGPMADHVGGADGIRMLVDSGKLEVIPLAHLRGRSIRNSIIISSEAENLTKEHIQLLTGRVDEGSNLWMDADLKQRDKAIFEKSQGIEKAIAGWKGEPLFGYVHLVQVERSATARLADKLDDV